MFDTTKRWSLRVANRTYLLPPGSLEVVGSYPDGGDEFITRTAYLVRRVTATGLFCVATHTSGGDTECEWGQADHWELSTIHRETAIELVIEHGFPPPAELADDIAGRDLTNRDLPTDDDYELTTDGINVYAAWKETAPVVERPPPKSASAAPPTPFAPAGSGCPVTFTADPAAGEFYAHVAGHPHGGRLRVTKAEHDALAALARAYPRRLTATDLLNDPAVVLVDPVRAIRGARKKHASLRAVVRTPNKAQRGFMGGYAIVSLDRAGAPAR